VSFFGNLCEVQIREKKILSAILRLLNSPRKPLPHPARHSGKTSKQDVKTTKTNPENKQLQISGSTQVMTVLYHISIASESSAITSAQYANCRTQQWTKITSLCAQNWTILIKNYQSCIGMPKDQWNKSKICH
jgi:hypothetical protein